jgi:hypothetical protein
MHESWAQISAHALFFWSLHDGQALLYLQDTPSGGMEQAQGGSVPFNQ